MAALKAVRLDRRALEKVLQSTEGPVAADLIRRCIRVESAAKRLCPVDSGRLRGSITHELVRQGRTLVGRVGTNVEYALAVHNGRRGFEARPGHVLRFRPTGSRVFIYRTRVGPARGQPFLRDALPAAG